MAGNKERSIGSKILRDRAMAVLRDTRAKIDPQFLAAMKERFSSLASGNAQPAKTEPKTPSSESFSKTMEDTKKEMPVYPTNQFKDDVQLSADDNKMEPVDRQKIAQIVLQYMKNKETGSKH